MCLSARFLPISNLLFMGFLAVCKFPSVSPFSMQFCLFLRGCLGYFAFSSVEVLVHPAILQVRASLFFSLFPYAPSSATSLFLSLHFFTISLLLFQHSFSCSDHWSIRIGRCCSVVVGPLEGKLLVCRHLFLLRSVFEAR